MALAITLTDVYAQASEVLDSFWTVFGLIVTMITSNPLLYSSILLGLGATLCVVCVTVVKKLKKVLFPLPCSPITRKTGGTVE